MTPDLTVFTASARADLAILWHRAIVRAFPRDVAAVEIYDDSSEQDLDASLLSGATVLRRARDRRDFQEAYNDALGRAATRWLAFVDTDAWPVSRAVWPAVRSPLENGAAAVACAPRRAVAGHDTVALFLDVAAYRTARAEATDGFLPRVEAEGNAPGAWRGHDTGDLLARAVEARGGRIETLRLEEDGTFVRFDALTNAFLLAAWAGEGALLSLARTDPYFREGTLGNLALRAVYERVVPGGPPFAFRVDRTRAWAAFAAGPRALADAARRARRMRRAARRLSAFLA